VRQVSLYIARHEGAESYKFRVQLIRVSTNSYSPDDGRAAENGRAGFQPAAAGLLPEVSRPVSAISDDVSEWDA